MKIKLKSFVLQAARRSSLEWNFHCDISRVVNFQYYKAIVIDYTLSQHNQDIYLSRQLSQNAFFLGSLGWIVNDLTEAE